MVRRLRNSAMMFIQGGRRVNRACSPPAQISSKPVRKKQALSRSKLLLLIKYTARFISTAWINRGVALLDVANDALLVHHESGAIGEALRFIENAVVFDHGALEI